MHARVIEAIRIVASDRHKLVILLGDYGAGKTALLKDVAPEVGGEYVNLNLRVTERLLATALPSTGSLMNSATSYPRMVALCW